MLIEWNKALCVGLPKVDEQHREMAGLLNELESAIAASASEAVIFALLESLYEHARAHFEFEEEVMSQMAYTDAVGHKREHLMLMGELKTFIARLRKGNENLDSVALQELKEWLVGHVLGSDRAFAEAVLESGLSL